MDKSVKFSSVGGENIAIISPLEGVEAIAVVLAAYIDGSR